MFPYFLWRPAVLRQHMESMKASMQNYYSRLAQLCLLLSDAESIRFWCMHSGQARYMTKHHACWSQVHTTCGAGSHKEVSEAASAVLLLAITVGVCEVCLYVRQVDIHCSSHLTATLVVTPKAIYKRWQGLCFTVGLVHLAEWEPRSRPLGCKSRVRHAL